MIELLASRGVIVVCAGGGGIPVVADDAGGLRGVEAVVDKDLTAAVLDGYGTPQARPIHRVTPGELRACSFPAGSMGPKVEAACRFAAATGGLAAIGRIEDAAALLDGTTGTIVKTGER